MTYTPENLQPEPAGYAEAVAELETILGEIERADVDVDALAARVQRANGLIEFCRGRISAAQDAVDGIVSGPSTTAASEPAEPDTDR